MPHSKPSVSPGGFKLQSSLAGGKTFPDRVIPGVGASLP